MDEKNTSLNYWRNVEEYPCYPNVLTRRLVDTNYVVSKLSCQESILDIGCGDGSMLLSLREFTAIKTFYGYDLSTALIAKLKNKWGNYPGLNCSTLNVNEIEKMPAAEVAISFGSFPYIFSEEELLALISKIETELFIVRAPCTLKRSSEVINKYSHELNANYAAIYRTVDDYIKILSESFVVYEVNRAYHDSIESNFGTKHFFFLCKKG